MLEVSYLAALFGGILSLLSPCSALLLPAFFTYAFQSRKALLIKTAVFYLGLAATLVPLGMGVSAVSRLVYGERSTLIMVSGLVIIALGMLQILGRGFDLGPLSRLAGRVRGESAGATFALGAVYGFAGFCSGPILGAVLTVAATSGQVFRGAGLLAVYALGMAAPLFLIAALWDRFDLGRRPWLRGRELSIGPLRVHTTNLVSGLMFVLLGTVFIAYEGTSALSGLYEENGAVDVAYAAEQWARSLANTVPDILVLAVVLAAALLLALRVYRRRQHKPRSAPDNVEEFAGERRAGKTSH
ncbi:MAG: Cytochrome c-type biogenesis protein CcdA (DsbD analog) [uncultured Rubrobacteraceae bacterium]|uniref:Cytochrome c-type biogenesis protein CcdA (DsbD analog) n=1 Tax=uncultured Rubrobacteraceae bacterium TaxID=349277 RepID=A0A6J4QSC9_9ACTN|nr:MAG: Cytochrome c-type biogenesis protein CcdA (DsbD analog) [uncultured Rubrobacteraceae bacterium]